MFKLSPGDVEHAKCYIRKKVQLAQNGKNLDGNKVGSAKTAAACADACVENGEDCDTFTYGKHSKICRLFKGAELNLELGGGLALRNLLGGWCPLNGKNPVPLFSTYIIRDCWTQRAEEPPV